MSKTVDNFGPNLRHLMNQNALSYVSLSERVGIPQSSLHDYVLNKHNISLDSALKIASYFGSNIDDMLQDAL